MKVLLIHNKYGNFSGEEAMVESTERVLTRCGHTVKVFYKESSTIKGPFGKFRAFFSSFHAQGTLGEIRTIVKRFSPDLVQIQNIYPLISAHVFRTVRKLGVPVIFRCANYRLFCPTGLMLRDGMICEKCASTTHLHCIQHNCERNLAKSITYGLRNEYARQSDLIIPYTDAFIVPSEFQKRKFVQWGIPEERIYVIPNPLPHKFREPAPASPFGDYVAYAGRISPEKGISLILEVAARHPEISFKLAGHGQKDYLNSLCPPNNVEYVGMRTGSELIDFYSNARFVVIPSQWYETFGLVAIEAMRLHKPVVAARIGALQETIIEGQNGVLFQHDSLEELEHSIVKLWEDRCFTSSLQGKAAQGLESRFSDEAFYLRLMQCYQETIVA